MSILTDLEAAYDAGLGDSHIFPCGRDTIAAIVAVAEAAGRVSFIGQLVVGVPELHAALAPLVKEADDE